MGGWQHWDGGMMGPGGGIVWLVLAAFLLVVPFWRLLPRIGIPAWVSVVAVVPFAAIVLLWIVAFSRWEGARDEG